MLQKLKKKKNNMHKLEKLILESFGEILQEKEKATLKLKDLTPKVRKALEDRYGKSEYPEYDFLDREMETYYQTRSVNKETGAVAHKVINLPSFRELYFGYSDIIDDIKVLMGNKEVQTDPKARDLFDLIKTNFRKIQNYLRNNRPDQYAMLKAARAMEESVQKLNEGVVKRMFTFLDDLRDSGETNMFGAGPYLSREFGLSKKEAREVLSNWMKSSMSEGMNNDESDLRVILNNNRDKIELDYGPRTFKMLKVELLVGNESYVHNWLTDKGYMEKEEMPFENINEEAGPETVLEDATDQMLEKFPTLKAALIKLQTEDFKEFVDKIDWISPRPTEFRINLTNGQDYILKWTGKGFEAQIMGKRYMIDKIDDYQQALDKLAILYKEGPMTEPEEPVEPADTDTGGGGGGDFPGDEAGGGDVPADDAAGDAAADVGGEEGGEDLTDEPVDFEEPAEEPAA